MVRQQVKERGKKIMWGTTRKSSNYVEETTGIKKDNDVVVVFF